MISLLFRNVTHRQIILKNTFWLGVAVGLAGLGDFVVTVAVIRRFGATQYGAFGYGLSFASLFSALFDFGLATAATREFAADKARERAFPDLLTLKAFIGLLGITVVAVGGLAISRDAVTRRMIMILGLYIFFMELSNLFYALYRSRQQMELEAFSRAVYGVGLVTFVALALAGRGTIVSVGVAYLGAAAVVVMANLANALFRETGLPPLRSTFNLGVWREFLGIGLYIAMVKVSSDITTNMGPVLLGYLGRVTQIGLYNAANKVNGLVLFPMSLAASAIFPALVNVRGAPERFARLWNEWVHYTLIISIPLSFLLFVEAGDIVAVLYRQRFGPAATALQILAVAVGVVYIQSLYYHALLIFNRQREIFRAVLNAAIVNVVLNVALVPRFGMYGVAAALVGTQGSLLCQYVILTGRYTPVNPVSIPMLRTLGISAVSALIAAVAVSVLPAARGDLLLAIPAGVLVYGGLVAVLMRLSKIWPIRD